MGAWKLLGETIDVVEIAVRLVLVLLLQLGIVESLIVKVLLVVDDRLADRLWLIEWCCEVC